MRRLINEGGMCVAAGTFPTRFWLPRATKMKTYRSHAFVAEITDSHLRANQTIH